METIDVVSHRADAWMSGWPTGTSSLAAGPASSGSGRLVRVPG